MKIQSPVYGRLLDDFAVGATYRHAWEVTVDEGMVALYAASFQDAAPLASSSEFARALGFRARPLPPLLCLNLGLSFSVEDISEQAIAHLAYVDVRFPHAGYAGDTVSARTTVLGVKASSSGDKGIVHVRTALETTDGRALCVFERKALVRAGRLGDRAATGQAPPVPPLGDFRPSPTELEARRSPRWPSMGGRPAAVGDVFAHAIGHTVGESEHMQLTVLLRNTHPLHFDALYCRDRSFTEQRVVYGGLILSWVAALASRDLARSSVWDLQYSDGAHPGSVAAGDTLYSASKIVAVEKRGDYGVVKMILVGTKNVTSTAALAKHGPALFEPELGKRENKIEEKVFEVRRSLLVKPPE